MEWLTQNWIWIVFAIGIFLLMRHGMGHGFGGHSHHSHDSGGLVENTNRTPLRDPVSGEQVELGNAVNSTYRGRVYYFISRENRDKFEAAPDQYASSPGSYESHSHHRHGC